MNERNHVLKGKTDWIFLIFLFLVTNQAVLSYKIIGLVFIYLMRPNLKFGFKSDRIPKFYLYIILLSIISLFLHIRDFSLPYLAAFLVANAFWVFSILTYHQLKLSLEKYGPEGILSTMKAFIVMNLLFSLYQLGAIINLTGKLNPYTGLDFPYGMSTGDNIFGFFMQNSYYNMMVSSLLGVYFIYKKELFYAVLSCICLILVFGNIGTMIFLGILLLIYISGVLHGAVRDSDRQVRISWLERIVPPGRFAVYIPALLILIAFFYSILSAENFRYVKEKIQAKVFNVKVNERNNLQTLTEARYVDREAYNPFRNIHETGAWEIGVERATLADLNRSRVTSEEKKMDMSTEVTMSYIHQFKGKTLSMLETVNYLKRSVPNALLGAGPVRFSSLTAQKMAGYDSSRLFLNVLPQYISPDYRDNHLLLIQGRINSESKYFSNANWPDSFYNQIFGEYGILGFTIFLVFYVGYFVKKVRFWTYGLWLFALIIPYLHVTYMFEPICVMVFFELLMETDIMENRNKQLAGES